MWQRWVDAILAERDDWLERKNMAAVQSKVKVEGTEEAKAFLGELGRVTSAADPRLVELTSVITGRRVAINVELIGEVRDNAHKIGALEPLTLVFHKKTRRICWRVREDYDAVMRASRLALE